MSLPKLPPLDSLSSHSNDDNPLDKSVIEEKGSESNDIDELSELRSNLHSDTTNSEKEDSNEVFAIRGAEEPIEDLTVVDKEDSNEAFGDVEEGFNFLPGVSEPVNSENLNTSKDLNAINPTEIDDSDYADSSHNEIDDVVKDFFVNLKNKIIKPKGTSNIAGDNSKSRLKRIIEKSGVVKKMLVTAACLIIVTLLGLLLVNLVGSGSKPLGEISHIAEGQEVNVLISNIGEAEDDLSVLLENQGDISTKFLLDISLTSKKSLFDKSKFTCMSDIVFLEAGESRNEVLKCKDFVTADEYSIDIGFSEVN